MSRPAARCTHADPPIHRPDPRPRPRRVPARLARVVPAIPGLFSGLILILAAGIWPAAANVGDANAGSGPPVPDLQPLCLDCHQGGSDRVQAPLLEGQQQDYLAQQLRSFQQRHRDNFPMSAIVAGMNEAELDDLARRLASRPWPSQPHPVTADAVARGRTVARQAGCQDCHGADLAGRAGDAGGPRLAGQHPGYLQRQLAAFVAGHRPHPERADGRPWLHESAARELDALSHYLHASGRSADP